MKKALILFLLTLCSIAAKSQNACPPSASPANFGWTRNEATDTVQPNFCVERNGTLIHQGVDGGAQVYNVKAFGAAGNGIADDGPPIMSAEAAASKSGGIVFFPPGTYALSLSELPLPLYSNVQLRGAGASSIITTLSPPSATENLFAGTSISKVRITGLNVTQPSGNAQIVIGFHVYASSSIEVDHCFASNAALFFSDSSSTTGYAGVTAANISTGITVHDNQLSAPGYNAIAGIGIVYTQNAVVSRNIITGYYSGIEIWGGDANANGGILNTRWDKNITLSANIGYANGAAGSNGGVFWTSMCEGCTETGNISYGAGDVGIDNEGSFAVSASGNYVYGAYHAAYGQFFYSRDITWSGNTAIMTAPTQACFEVWNGAQDLTPFDLNFSGNNCWNQGTGIASAGTINGSVDDLRMSANNFRNVALDLSSTNMHRALIEGNVFTFTQSHAGPLYAILASGFNATDAGGSHLSIAHNQIFSDAAQPSGSAAIYISHGDPNEPMRVSITGNDISGSSPFPTDVALHESSTNLQAIYAKIEMNTFAVPLVTKTIDSGNGAINTYYLGNVSLALTSYTGP